MKPQDLYKIANKYFDHNEQLSEFELIDNELKELRKREIKGILKNLFEAEALGDYYKELKMIKQQSIAKRKLAAAVANNNTYCFITINPKSDIELAQFVKKVEKLANRNLFTSVLWVYEQRGNTESTMGTGFHAHILAKRNVNYKPCKIANCVRNTCKTLVKDIKSNNLVNIQFIGESWADDKRQYILGEKIADGKAEKQVLDKKWRIKNNLKPYYNNAPQGQEISAEKPKV